MRSVKKILYGDNRNVFKSNGIYWDPSWSMGLIAVHGDLWAPIQIHVFPSESTWIHQDGTPIYSWGFIGSAMLMLFETWILARAPKYLAPFNANMPLSVLICFFTGIKDEEDIHFILLFQCRLCHFKMFDRRGQPLSKCSKSWFGIDPKILCLFFTPPLWSTNLIWC